MPLAAAKTGFWPEMSVISIGWGLGFVFAVQNPYDQTLGCFRCREACVRNTVWPRATLGPGISGRGLALFDLFYKKNSICFFKKRGNVGRLSGLAGLCWVVLGAVAVAVAVAVVVAEQ